jgi:hypothetical protein
MRRLGNFVHFLNTGLGAGASNEIKDACTQASLIGCFVRPQEGAHALIFVIENDAPAEQGLALDSGHSIKGITRKALGTWASGYTYG